MTVDTGLLARIRATRRRLATDGPPAERHEGDYEVVSLPVAEADLLCDVLRAETPSSALEIGLAYGTSALAVADALVASGGRTFVVIDAYQDRFGDVGRQLLTDAGLDPVCEVVAERSQLALPALIRAGRRFDVAFVDGSHIFHSVFVDLAFVRELVRPGGLVVLDDCAWPSVATALAYFETNCGWVREPIDADTRLTACRLPDPPVEPAFTDFVPFGQPRS